MRPPNLYYTKSGQRQCLKCKQKLGIAYREANAERLKKQRKIRLAAKKAARAAAPPKPPRPPRILPETVRQKIIKQAKAVGHPIIEGHDV